MTFGHFLFLRLFIAAMAFHEFMIMHNIMSTN